MIKKITVKASLPDAALLSEAALAGQPSGVVVGVAFDDGAQFCLPLGQVKQQRKGKGATFSNQLQPRGNLRVKRNSQGALKIKYTQKGKVELPSASPQAMAFGIYSAEPPYSGVAGLRIKGRTKLVTRKDAQ
jgi:hypothetical protein